MWQLVSVNETNMFHNQNNLLCFIPPNRNTTRLSTSDPLFKHFSLMFGECWVSVDDVSVLRLAVIQSILLHNYECHVLCT